MSLENQQIEDDYKLARALQEQEDQSYVKSVDNKQQKDFEKQKVHDIKNQDSSVSVDYTRGQLGAFKQHMKKQCENVKEYYDPEMDDYYDDYYDENDFAVNQSFKKKHPKIDLSERDENSRPESDDSDDGDVGNGNDDGEIKESFKKGNNKKFRDEDEEFDFDTEINVRSQVSHSVTGKLTRDHKKIRQRKVKTKDVSDRATVESVMDYRTRMILFRMINRQMIGSINGCVSTGKEANVYSAKSVNGKTYFAVKVYKTSILQFKDRERYIEGEFRFQRYSKHNPRKMVKMWAEKEMRNLKRMASVGLPVPKVHSLQQHVLVMQFIGRKGWPAKLLKDTKFTTKKYRRIYKTIIKLMRGMFQKARLIHADFSEYNILFYRGKVIIIDVSQSVEFDHPNAMVFLRNDCSNIRDYFRKKGVTGVLSLRQMFEIITNEGIEKSKMDDMIEKIMSGEKDLEFVVTNHNDQEDDVFKGTFMPQTMEEIPEDNFERFRERFMKKKETGGDDDDENENEESEDDDGEEEGEGEGEGEEEKKDLATFLKGMDRKERKKYVKRMQAEKRKKKVPKKVKKRRKKVSRRGNKSLKK